MRTLSPEQAKMRLWHFMSIHNLDQQAIARQAQVSREHVNRVLNGKAELSLKLAEHIGLVRTVRYEVVE